MSSLQGPPRSSQVIADLESQITELNSEMDELKEENNANLSVINRLKDSLQETTTRLVSGTNHFNKVSFSLYLVFLLFPLYLPSLLFSQFYQSHKQGESLLTCPDVQDLKFTCISRFSLTVTRRAEAGRPPRPASPPPPPSHPYPREPHPI